MGVKTKHTDPTLNSFSTDDLIINVQSGSLFFKSNTTLFKLQGDDQSTTDVIEFSGLSSIIQDTDGNIGIGTTTPPESLTVEGNISASGDLYVGGGTITGAHSNAVIQMDGSVGSNLKYSDNFVRVDSADVEFWTDDTQRMAVKGTTGNVGIGTSTPGEKLEVVGAIKIPKANTTDNGSPGLVLVSDDDFTYTGAAGSSQYINHYGFGFHNPLGANPTAGSGAYISGYFGVDIFTGGNNRLHIAQGGNVGIGTSSPSRKLVVDIGTGNQGNQGIRIQGQNNGILSFQNGTSTGDALYPLIYGQASSTLSSVSGVAGLAFRGKPPQDHADNPSFIMRGQNQAYDGQSTASPIIRFQNYVTDHFVIDFDGTLTGTDTSIGSLSDKRLKKNIENYQYDLEKFKQFKTKKFDWINPQEHGNKSQQIGFIAQDLEKIDPRWVKDYLVNIESPDTEFLDKDRMSKTTPLGQTDSMYISIIQQLIVKIENVEKELKELKNGK